LIPGNFVSVNQVSSSSSSHLQRITVSAFRNLRDQTISLGAGRNLFVGSNGQGKTSLLEAVYVLATGKSFRGATASNLIRFDAPALRLVGEVAQDIGSLTLAVELVETPTRSRRFLAGGKGLTPAGYLGLLPTVAVTAERMGIVRGGPDERRRFLDRGILLESPRTAELYRSIEKLLRQKNALLASGQSPRAKRESLEAWNRPLAEQSARLRTLRRSYAQDLAKHLPSICDEIGKPSGKISFDYRPSPEGGDDAAELLFALEKEAENEIGAGRTRLGPGRDEVDILLDGRPLRHHGSAGEQKAFVLSLKVAKIERASRFLGSAPLLLLDDLDAELDRNVLRRFLGRLPAGHQILATSAKEEWIEPLLELSDATDVSRFRVEGGEIRFLSEPLVSTDEIDHRMTDEAPRANRQSTG